MGLLTASADTRRLEDRLLEIAGQQLIKQADDAVPAYNLSGMLYLSTSGWLMLSVSSAFVRGAFSMMDEPGTSLPLNAQGRLEPHISVMNPREIARIGGPTAIVHDRGKRFSFSLGRLVEVLPKNWYGVSRAWLVRVHSPALMELRRSHGLSSLPHDGKFSFHITLAIRKDNVTGYNSVSKDTPVLQQYGRNNEQAQQQAGGEARQIALA